MITLTNIEPIDKTLRKIKKKWDKDQENWTVFSNIDRDGNREMMINQAPTTWWLKMKQISPYNSMAYGKEIRNIGSEITEKIEESGGKAISKNKDLLKQLGLFAMGVPIPKKEEILYTSGVEMHNPEVVNTQKAEAEEKETDADRLYRKYLREKWKRTQQLRDNMYM